jgi:hypothetical protein
MIKSTLKFISVLCFFLTSNVFAGYIATDLTEDTYITYKGYDWTWASSVNVTNYEKSDFFTGEIVSNTFEDASVHSGWLSFTTGSDLDVIFQELTLSDFMRNNTAVQSFAYWNSFFDAVDPVFDEGHANFNPLEFALRSGMKDDTGDFENNETFYVRASIAPTISVPEPTTLLILAIGLLGVVIRQKIAK